MSDLNKTPTLGEEEVNPQDSGTGKKLQIHADSATSPAPKRLPPQTSVFSEAPATAWRGSDSAVPKHLAMPTPASGDGDGVPAVRDVNVSPLFRHGRVVEMLSRNVAGGGLCGNENPASPCQTTMDLDCYAVSEGKSESYKLRNSWDNSNSKTVPVDLDTLPDESPVELQFPWNPVHDAEAPLHTTLFLESSENLQVSARKLTPKELEEDQRLREVAFHAAFKLETQRCTPTSRCRSCLAFCQKIMPNLPSLQEGCGTGQAMQNCEDCPPVLRNVADEVRQKRKKARQWPKSKSSGYRGVTKRAGRWVAHIWHDGDQIHLGSSKTKEEAARVFDQAALALEGPDAKINFQPESYQSEIAYLYKLSKEQLVIYLRRDSQGFEAQAAYPGVKHVGNFYEATYEYVFFERWNSYKETYEKILLGTFDNEEDAARAVFKEAVSNPHVSLADLILDTHHVRNMPSYAAQRFAALNPEGKQLRNQATAITSKRLCVLQRPPKSTSTPQMKKRTDLQRRQVSEATQRNQGSTFPPAAAIAIAAPIHSGADKLPGHKINGNIEVIPGARTPTRSLGAYLEPGTLHQHAAGVNLAEAQHLNISLPQQTNNGTNTATYLQLLRNLLPKFFRAPPATTASSSCGGPRVPSIPSIPRETWGIITMKLFGVEIVVAVEPGGDRNQAPQLRNHLTLPPSKRSRITRAGQIN